jgi:hypothetical protein
MSQAMVDEGTVVRAVNGAPWMEPNWPREREREPVADERRVADQRTRKLVQRGWELRAQLEALEEECAIIDRQLLAAHGTGVSLVLPGVCRVTLTRSDLTTIADPVGLEALLGPRFKDLVLTTYKPTARLLELAASGDAPEAFELRPLLRLSTRTQASWRADVSDECLVVAAPAGEVQP